LYLPDGRTGAMESEIYAHCIKIENSVFPIQEHDITS